MEAALATISTDQEGDGGGDPSRPEGEEPESKRSPRVAAAVVAVAVAAWLVVAAISLFNTWSSAREGLAILEEVRAGASASSLRSGDDGARLREAEASFSAARRRVRSWAVSPLRALPVAGRQLRSVDALTAAAARAAGIAGEALDSVNERLAGGLPASPQRDELLGDLALVAGQAEDRLATIDLGPDQALVGPLADARARAAGELGELRESARRARLASSGLAGLLAGDSTQLLLLGNNAEMRAGSGMFLTVGTLAVEDGSLRVEEIVPTFDFQLAQGVPLEEDLADRWGWLEPGRDWRNLGVTPRFDVTAPLAARMWAAARGEEVDGVLALDVLALQALLAAVGPIEVDGQQLDAGNVAAELLHDQYVGLDSGDQMAQAERRGRLGEVARRTLEALEGSDVDVARLAEELAGAARARHMLAWSGEAPVQQGWEAMGLDGRLQGDELLVAVLNRGGNKLDSFLEVEAELSMEQGQSTTAVAVQVQLTNTATADEPPYILGPSPPLSVAPGTYVGLVAATLPGAAGAGRFDGYDSLAVAGADGPARVVAVPVEIPRGEERTVTLRFELPPGAGSLDVLPSARVPPMSWRWQDRVWQDDHTELVVW